MNEDLALFQFERDFIIQSMVKEAQFEQWLKLTFFLNYELLKKRDTIYQGAFYIKLYELLTEGLKYAKSVLYHLDNSDNIKKREWYNILVNTLNGLLSELTEPEFNYIEYRVSHRPTPSLLVSLCCIILR
ncbi:MAG: hypothetical protein BGP13_14255 [Sphingobacteriales bacterium 40-81]|nr:MAG: hypothetical protein BGP13_14255 [Sphingobacteriales bacterium 40-81]